MVMNLVLNGTAEELLGSIAKDIKNRVNNYFEELRRDGKYEMFKELPAFAQRVTFFAETSWHGKAYKRYREAIKDWILFGDATFHYGRKTFIGAIPEEVKERAGEVYSFGRGYKYRGYWSTSELNEMSKMRRSLIENNPILLDSNIPECLRQTIFNSALKNNKEYQAYKKSFNHFVNKVVSTMISNYLNENRGSID